MKLIWVSDIHLNFLDENSRKEFYKKLQGDAIIISGDIAESHNVVPLIEEMQGVINKPVWFVLGNHDYYGSTIATVKRNVSKLHYLPKSNYVALNASTALLGIDGWGDCRNGDFENSQLTMGDWLHIKDLRSKYLMGMDYLKDKLQSLADADARSLKRKVHKAIKDGFKRIIIVTHVPPFEEACLYAGSKSTPSGLPFFSSKILGDTILPIAKKHPELDFLWISGHTHSRAVHKPCANMVVKVAKADYFHPQIEEIILI
jgi:predicted phosphohydrolase